MVTNIGMERSCGLVDYRLQHLKYLEAVSRSIILKKTQSLRESKPTDFRGFKEELEKVKELKLKWSKSMKEKQTKGSDEKQEVAKNKEVKRLDTLDFLSLKEVHLLMNVKWRSIWIMIMLMRKKLSKG